MRKVCFLMHGAESNDVDDLGPAAPVALAAADAAGLDRAELAQKLGVSGRTIRTDVDRLRSLGYPVHATRGAVGGYRLGAGAELPPLLLDDEEAVAVTIGLQDPATGNAVAGIEDASFARWPRWNGGSSTLTAAGERAADIHRPGARVWIRPERRPRGVDTIAAACRDHEQLRFDYGDHAGNGTRRPGRPHRLVTWGRRWYLVAWDVDKADWRTFRVDRMELKVPNGPRFAERDLPSKNIASYVARRVSAARWRLHTDVVVHAPAALVSARINPAMGTIERDRRTHCLFTTGADNVQTLAVYLGLLGMDFTVSGPPRVDRPASAARRPLSQSDRYRFSSCGVTCRR